jgi:hypothetical protein
VCQTYEMPMLMMLFSSFSDSNTRVLHPSPIKESRPEIKDPRVSNGKGNASRFYFLVVGTKQGWFGVYSFIATIIYISQLT